MVANHVEMLSGRRKKDYEAESAANALAAQATVYGDDAADIAAAAEPVTADSAEEEAETVAA